MAINAHKNSQLSRRFLGEYFARRAAALMGRRGKIAWTSAMKYVTRTLYSRTGSGLHTLTDLLDLPVTLRNVSKPVKLVVVTSLRFTQGKLIRLVQTGHAILPLLRNHPLFRNDLHKLSSMVNLLKMYRALLRSDKKDGGRKETLLVPVNLLTK